MCRIRSILQLLFSLISITHGKANPSKRLVCVIGAGPNGLMAVKHLADYPQDFIPIAFERNSDVGGMWIYTDNTNVNDYGLPVTMTYAVTPGSNRYFAPFNITFKCSTTDAKEFMSCPDYEEIRGEDRSSIKHETVLDYLRNYTDHFNLRQYIQFDTLVEKITPKSYSESRQPTKWLIQYRSLSTNQSQKITCDATIVAPGCFNIPKIPKIPGMDTFPGRVIHSQTYRRPENFTGQTVMILGASVSGLDIAFDLSKHVKTIYLSHRHSKIEMEMPKNVIQVAGVVAAHGNELTLQDDSTVTADAFIYCTGYKNDLPFLNSNSGIEIHDKYLYPMYRRTINVQHPTMAVLGFTRNIVSFCPKIYAQTRYYVTYLQGKIQLPSHKEMLDEAKLMAVEKMPVTSKTSWAYVNQLVEDGKFEPKVPKAFEEAATLWEKIFVNNRLHYKEYKMNIFNNGTITIVKLDINEKYLGQ